MSQKFKGYVLGVLAAASYGLNPLFALPLYRDGMDVDSVLLFRYLLAIPIIAVMVKARGRNLRIGGRDALALLLLGLTFAFSSLTLFESYNYMDVGIASTLLFIYPILVAVIMALFFKEKFSLQTVFCLALALVGIALLYKGGDGATLSVKGTLIVFVSSLTYAIYIVAVNQSKRIRQIPTLVLTFYALLFGSLLFMGRAASGGGLQLPSAWYLWGNLLGLAVFPTAISLICTTKAVQYIGSTPTAILGAMEPLTAVLVGVCVFGERLEGREVCGLLLIIAAVSLVVAGQSITSHLVNFREMFPKLTRK